jgi:hypothetical protein
MIYFADMPTAYYYFVDYIHEEWIITYFKAINKVGSDKTKKEEKKKDVFY